MSIRCRDGFAGLEIEPPDRAALLEDDQPFRVRIGAAIVAMLGLMLLGEEGRLHVRRPAEGGELVGRVDA